MISILNSFIEMLLISDLMNKSNVIQFIEIPYYLLVLLNIHNKRLNIPFIIFHLYSKTPVSQTQDWFDDIAQINYSWIFIMKNIVISITPFN